jgi:hypothetical protein
MLAIAGQVIRTAGQWELKLANGWTSHADLARVRQHLATLTHSRSPFGSHAERSNGAQITAPLLERASGGATAVGAGADGATRHAAALQPSVRACAGGRYSRRSISHSWLSESMKAARTCRASSSV